MESGILYVSDTVADAPGGLIVALQLVSHVPIAVATCYALSRRKSVLGAWGVASLLASPNYHACRGALACLALSLDSWRRTDHFTSLALGAALALELIHYRGASAHGRTVGRFLTALMPFVVLLAVQAFPFQMQSALLVVAYVALVAIDRFLRTSRRLTPPNAAEYKARSLIIGGLLLLAAVACYAFDGGDGHGDSVLSGVLHVAWHLLIGAALIAIVHGLPPEPPEVEDEYEDEALSVKSTPI
jgi:hypothetical protein